MIEKVMFFLADIIITVMGIIGVSLIVSGVLNKNSETTLLGFTLAIMAIMIVSFV